MSRLNLNIFIFNLFFLSPVFVFSYNFQVIQPRSVLIQHVNQDQTASIRCEHDSPGTKLQDVRLNRISQTGEKKILCQKGMPSCENVIMSLNSNKFVFTLQNIGPEAMRATYQCEVTVEYQDADITRIGTNTTLLYDFKVIQHVQHVNQDQTASISCEHDWYGSKLQDVRLYRIPQTGEEEILCQKKEASCENVTMSQNSSKYVFTLKNIGPEAMRATYQCEITVEYQGVYYTRRGTKTILLYDAEDCPSLDMSVLEWILIGLLTLMFLYSCLITCLYLRLTVTNWKNTNTCENSTYVVMKQPTRGREDIYQSMQS